MTVTVTKPAFNLRDTLNSLKKKTGLFGEQIMRADTVADYYGIVGNNRNLIINGDFKIWQRATSFSYTVLPQAAFMPDRFWAYTANASSGTMERSTDVPTGQPFNYSFFNNTNSSARIGTNVELNSQGLPAPFVVGNTYTISFWIKGSSSSAATLRLTWRNQHADGTNEVVIANGVDYNWTTSWTRVVYTFSISALPNANNRVLDFELSLPAGGKITGVQLEQGPGATPFENRPIGTELALCQRYYQKIAAGLSGLIGQAWFWTSTVADVYIPLKVTMRTSPAVVQTTGTSYFNFQALATAFNFSSFTGADMTSPDAIVIYATVPSGTIGTSGYMYTMNANSFLALNAEL